LSGRSQPDERIQRYVAWFHELDAWTEYWDVYHPETCGRYYFGDGVAEPGLLTLFLPHRQRPAPFIAWTRMALTGEAGFEDRVRDPTVSAAILEVDRLIAGLFEKHFGDADNPTTQSEYLDATFLFAIDALPPATERDARIADSDPRKRTAGRHTLDGDIMWFAWSLHTEAAELLAPDKGHARRALSLAGVAMGCAANYAWHGHRRTRPEYAANDETACLLHQRGLRWAEDFAAAACEVHALYRFREWGHE
jgi:hypothetical protein